MPVSGDKNEPIAPVPADAPRPETAAGGAAPPPPDAGARVDIVPPPAPAEDEPAPPKLITASPGAVRAPALEKPESAGGGLPDSLLSGELAEQRPELIVAGAFVGAFLVARILKRISG